MPEISAKAIKQLRDKTGASVMMIKKALAEARGDETHAMEVLKSLGHDEAAKKETRETRAGCVDAYVHAGSKVGVLVELRSETDFVARNDEFRSLAHNIAMHIAAMKSPNLDALIREPSIKDPTQTIGDLVKKASASFGEHLEIRRFERFEL